LVPVLDDSPSQKIILTHVLAYTDTVFDEDINRSFVRARNFAELPLHYKSMSRQRDFNCLCFLFETGNVDDSKYYILSISGTAWPLCRVADNYLAKFGLWQIRPIGKYDLI